MCITSSVALRPPVASLVAWFAPRPRVAARAPMSGAAGDEGRHADE
jgi:hypothetical protein